MYDMMTHWERVTGAPFSESDRLSDGTDRQPSLPGTVSCEYSFM